MDEKKEKNDRPIDMEISDDDIYDAMKDMQGYLDITPADLKELYTSAYRHALERITQSVKARDIMTGQVLSVKRTTPLKEVAELMAAHEISGIPVVEEDGKAAGIISEKDFLSLMGARGKMHFMAVVAEYLKRKDCLAMPVNAQKAEDIMTSPAITVSEDTAVREISDIMTGKNINRVPVIGTDGKLAGIVSRSDVLRALLIAGRSLPQTK